MYMYIAKLNTGEDIAVKPGITKACSASAASLCGISESTLDCPSQNTDPKRRARYM